MSGEKEGDNINLNASIADLVQRSLEYIHSENVAHQEYSLRVLINSTLDEKNRNLVFSKTGTKAFADLFRSTSEVVQMLAAWLLSHIALDDKISGMVLHSDMADHFIPLLNSENSDVQEKVLWVFNNLLLNDVSGKFLEQFYVIEKLTHLLRSPIPKTLITTSRILEPLLHKDTNTSFLENQATFIKNRGIEVIAEILAPACPPRTVESLKTILDVLNCLSLYSEENRITVANSTAFSWVLAFAASPYTNEGLLEKSLQILYNISLTETSFEPLVNRAAIPIVITLLNTLSPRSPNKRLLELSLLTLANLMVDVHARLSSRKHGLASALIRIANILTENKMDTDNSEMERTIVEIAANAAIDDFLRAEFQCEGAVEQLSRLLTHPNTEIVEIASTAITNLNLAVPAEIIEKYKETKKNVSTVPILPMQDKQTNVPKIPSFKSNAPAPIAPTTNSTNPKPETKAGLNLSSSSSSASPKDAKRQKDYVETFNLSNSALDNAFARLELQASHSEERILQEEEKLILKRKQIIGEIFQTEKTFVNNMATFIRVYLNPLLQRKSGSLSQDLIPRLFLNIQELFTIHSEFLKEISLRILQNVGETSLSDLFIELWTQPDIADAYRIFYTGFDGSLSVLAEQTAKSPKFKAYLQGCDQEKDCEGLNFSAFFIMPMQRITRYGVLLKELYENSPNLPKERTALLAALDAMQKFESNMKNFQREAQEYAKLVDIKKSLEHISKAFLLETQKEVLYEGLVVEYDAKGSRHIQIFLFSDILIICGFKNKTSSATQFKMQMENVIELSNLEIADLPADKATGQRMLKFKWSEGETTIYVTEKEMKQWVASIGRAKKANQSKNKTIPPFYQLSK